MGGRLKLLKYIAYACLVAAYEPSGQEFESLQARQITKPNHFTVGLFYF